MRSPLFSALFGIWLSLSCAYGQQAPTPVGVGGGTFTTPTPALAAPTPAPTESVKKGRLEGKVTHLQTGEPLRKANIRLQPSRPSPGMPFEQSMRSVTSDDQGAFVFENVAAGSYMLFAERQGFVRQTYGARSGSNSGMQPVTVTADQTTSGLLFRLMPQAVVTGRILDEDGEPLEHVQVMLMRSIYRMGKRQMAPTGAVNTNDQGEFRIAGVAPGKYYLRAEQMNGRFSMNAEQSADSADKPQIVFAATFYPNASAVDAATPLDIKPGQDLPGMDIRLRKDKAYRVSGKIVGAPAGPLLLTLQSKDNAGMGGFGRNANRVENGEFTVRNVLPGSYYLVAMQGQGGRMGPISRTEVEVTNRNVEGISLVATPPVQLTGTVRIDGEEKTQLAAEPANNRGFPGREPAQETGTRSNLTVILTTNDNMQMNMPMARASTEGSFTIKDVPPMNYQVAVTQPDQTLYVKSVRYNGQDVGETGLNLGSGGGGTLEIVLRRGAGQITGVVQGADGKPMQGAIVSIVPEPQQPQLNALYRQVNTDQTGSFRAAGLRPGKYKVHAWEQLENGATQDPTFLEPYKGKGTEVALEEKGAPAITLSVIPAAEMVGP